MDGASHVRQAARLINSIVSRKRERECVCVYLHLAGNPDCKTKCIQQIKHQDECYGKSQRSNSQMTSPRLRHQAQPKAAPCWEPRGTGVKLEPQAQQHARRDTYVAGVAVTLTVWCSSHWSRSGPSSKPHTGCSSASQESRNGKASQVQQLETPPTPNCHGCLASQASDEMHDISLCSLVHKI